MTKRSFQRSFTLTPGVGPSSPPFEDSDEGDGATVALAPEQGVGDNRLRRLHEKLRESRNCRRGVSSLLIFLEIVGSILIIFGGILLVKPGLITAVERAGLRISVPSGLVVLALGAAFILFPVSPYYPPRGEGANTADTSSMPPLNTLGGSTIYTDDSMAVSPDKIRVSGLRATGQHKPPQVDDYITVNFTLRNDGKQPVTLGSTFVGARDPSKENSDFGEENYDKTLAPGDTLDISDSILVAKKGVWKFWPCYTIGTTYCPDEWRAFQVAVAEGQ